MRQDRTLEELWRTAPAGDRTFAPDAIAHLPPVARRYLQHAFAPGARLSTAVRLTMTGTIRLAPGWCGFEAVQVLRWDRGFVWRAGPDISRAAAGRLHAEAVWLPASLLGPGVSWADRGDGRTVASFSAHGERSELELEVSPEGAVSSCRLMRWGDLNTGTFGYHPFGGTFDEERTFDGVTLPVRLRAGWGFGTPAFETAGEFFRCTLETVAFRRESE